ncbi:MAG: hypothetical protein CMF48_04880 [Legionellales bacterium]|nr:hypothetical protein [Legionellales bacterium]|tara:strand:- start:476 stop:1186 length:711 start_codon:yes stop_codon:yes gene_type:complete
MRELGLFGVVMLLGSSVAFASETIIGSGAVITEKREIGKVDVLKVSGTGSLSIERSEDGFGLWIEAEDNVMPHIVSNLENDVLEISIDAKRDIHPVHPIHYLLKVSDVQRIQLQGNATLEASDFSTDKLKIEVGDAAVALVDINADEIDWDIKGAGTVKASGKVKKQKVAASEKAKFNASDIKANSVEVLAHDNALVDVSADDELSVAAAEKASVKYHGKAKLTKSVSDDASITTS